ncbi:SRPBCC family protein [Nocardia sp. NBC_00403]|uniref:SRPBCC family protein n=1 Tax=Nocardia sp. NBC_00403 TaxID=2975990 RepID=UPI002E24AFC1
MNNTRHDQEMERTMNAESYTTTFTVDRTPEEVFSAITNVRGWWPGEIEGGTSELGDEFTYRYQDLHHSKQRITESIPGERVVWLVVEGGPNFVEDRTEWKGTRISFELSEKDEGTQVRFTHFGLVPEYECFDACSDAWGSYINGSLRNLIVAGTGRSGHE